MQNRSEQINELATATCLMQAELPVAKKISKGQRSKFADLVEVMDKSRPILAKYGLSVIQQLTHMFEKRGEDSIIVEALGTILMHKSGQYITSLTPLWPDRNAVNGSIYNHLLGSAITYTRRYAYMAIIGMVAEEEDNDGEPYPTKQNQFQQNSPYQSDKISSQQLSELHHALKGYEKLVDKIKAHFAIRELKDIPAKEYQWTIDKVRALKHAETGAVT